MLDSPFSARWWPAIWGPAVCTGKYGFLAKSTGKTGKIPEKILIFSDFLEVFQAQILRKYSRRPSRSFWYHLELRRPKFDRFRSTFSFFFGFLTPQNPTVSWKSNFFPLFFKEQALKPCSGPRSHDLQQLAPIESSPNPNLTDLVKKDGFVFHFFSDTRYMPGKTSLLPLISSWWNFVNLNAPSFPFFFFTDSTYTSNLLFSAWCLRHNRVVQQDRRLATTFGPQARKKEIEV